MAITTYAELQAAAANWLVRADLTARTPEFIALAEVRLNDTVRLRRAEIDVSMTGVPASRFVPLPAAYTEALNCWIVPPGSVNRVEMNFIDPATLPAYGDAGQPAFWTIDGANLGFERPCDQAYSFVLRCLESFVLSDAAPTNSLLTRAPNAYLFATLCEAGPFLRNADLWKTFEAKLATAIADLNAKEARSRAQVRLRTEPGELTRYRTRSGYNIRTDA